MVDGKKDQTNPNSTAAPFTPRRPSFSSSRLSIQTSASRGSPNSTILDPALGYSVARRPRLDFARACTSLHHSTLAEQSSPESSPLAANAFPAYLPRRTLDSPIVLHNCTTPSIGSSSVPDSSAPSGDDSETTSEDDELELDLTTTETPISMSFRPVEHSTVPSSQQAMQAAASISLMRHQKARLRGRSSRHSSSSASASGSSMASPSPTTPPAQQTGHGHSYFTRMADAGRRRDSLTQALKDSFMLDSGNNRKSDEDRNGATQSVDPIKRVVTRRGSLLPKTKNFQRIKAALQEETSIVDMEVKREAEITRQLREEDEGAMTTNALPAEAQRSVESPIEDEAMDDTQSTITPPVGSASRPKDLGLSFSQQAQLNGFFSFDSLESVSGSPPRFPPTRKNSDGDVIMNSDSAVSSPVVPTEIRRAKRRRTQDERFEAPTNFKRRAVSPGVCHSPVLGGSPSAAPTGGGKRLNFQGMNDANDSLMKMALQ